MMSENKMEPLYSNIWEEEAEPDNPFAASVCYCHGFDVYGDLLGKASWIDYLYLLFQGEPPSSAQGKLLEGLAIVLANPGIRDHGIQAATASAVGLSSSAACLMSALAVGAGNLAGAREIIVTMDIWKHCELNLEKWRNHIAIPLKDARTDVWTPLEHPPGFDPYGAKCATPVCQTLDYLSSLEAGPALPWLNSHRIELEDFATCPLAMTGVVAAGFHDLGFEPEQAEMLHLLLKLPGAAVHALEHRKFGHKKYPYFGNGLVLTNDPGIKQENALWERKK